MRLGILHTHPVQYVVPWFRELSQRMEVEVFYAHRQDRQGQAGAGFGVEFDWDVPLLEGYRHRFLKNVARQPGLATFGGCDTPELYELIQPNRFDAFLVFGWNRKSFIQAIRAGRRNRVPVLMRGDSQLRTPRSRMLALIKYLPYRFWLPRLAGHLYVGQRNKEYLRHYGVPEARLFFAPHFVDNDFFAQRAEAARTSGAVAEFRRQFGIPADAFVFLFVGKFLPKKRAADFLRACHRAFALPAGADLHAVLVGDGPLRAELEQLAQPFQGQIHFAGFRNQTELPVCYAASDALVLPSDGGETWGLVVNEAMAAGLPAIVSEDVGCAPDLIAPGATGFTYPLGDVAALAERMMELVHLSRSRPEHVREALVAKASDYSMARATTGLEQALQHCRSMCRGTATPAVAG